MEFKGLRRKYKSFIFESYFSKLSDKGLELFFLFRVPPDIQFRPSILVKNLPLQRYDPDTLNNFIFHMGLAEMPSYWKATCSPRIVIKPGHLNEEQIRWWHDLFINGMGQYFYENKIDFRDRDFIKINADGSPNSAKAKVGDSKTLIPIGGGKDSSVTSEILSKNLGEIGAFVLKSINVTSNIKASMNIAKVAKLKEAILVERIFDPTLFKLNKQGFLNGHTPFTSYLSFLSIFVSYLFGYKNVALSNEASSNEENLEYLGLKINHQYSKSFEFESAFRKYNNQYLSNINYFSFLRPLYELQIAKLFGRYPKYFKVIKSCNKGQMNQEWCCICAKCLSTFILLYPFLGPSKILKVFPRNLYSIESLSTLLLDLAMGDRAKPFECVGTREELKAALFISLKYHNLSNLPILLRLARNQILPRNINWERVFMLKEEQWNEDNNLSSKFEKILRKCLYKL